jgi:pyridoxal phosphate enzyme (YggS family)
VKGRIAHAARSAGRKPSDVTLMAVSKTKTKAEIEALVQAGQKIFGENRVQEAQNKWLELKAKYPDVKVHLIGPLQTNKVRAAIQLFDAIHSLDRPKLAHTLARVMEEEARHIPLYIQVNTGNEAQKAGVSLDDVGALVQTSRDLGLTIEGLMAIPPVDDHPGPHFALLAKLAKQYGLPGLSMGMSGDYEQAVQLGATVVRVGTALFGARN